MTLDLSWILRRGWSPRFSWKRHSNLRKSEFLLFSLLRCILRANTDDRSLLTKLASKLGTVVVKCHIWTYGHCPLDNLKLLRDDLTTDGWEWDNHSHKFWLISASNQRKRSDGPGRGLGCSPSCRDHHMVALYFCHLYLSPMSPHFDPQVATFRNYRLILVGVFLAFAFVLIYRRGNARSIATNTAFYTPFFHYRRNRQKRKIILLKIFMQEQLSLVVWEHFFQYWK